MPCGKLVRPVTLAVGGSSKNTTIFPSGRVCIWWSLSFHETPVLLFTMKDRNWWAHLQRFLRGSGGTRTHTYTHLFPAGSDSSRPNKQDKYTQVCSMSCLVIKGSRVALSRTAACRATSLVAVCRLGLKSHWFRGWRCGQVSAGATQPRDSFGSLLAARQAWG